MSDLSRISEGIDFTGRRADAERMAHNNRLGKPDVWVPGEREPYGVGWFRRNGYMVAYQYTYGGYDLNPIFALEESLVIELHKVVTA